MKTDLLGGLSIVVVIVALFSVGVLFGKCSTKYEAARVGAGFYTVNPINGYTSFVWNTNKPAQ